MREIASELLPILLHRGHVRATLEQLGDLGRSCATKNGPNHDDEYECDPEPVHVN